MLGIFVPANEATGYTFDKASVNRNNSQRHQKVLLAPSLRMDHSRPGLLLEVRNKSLVACSLYFLTENAWILAHTTMVELGENLDTFFLVRLVSPIL